MQWPWKKSETDLDREVHFHLETLADAYERDGMSRKEALRRARADFGGVEKIKDECRDESRWNWLIQLKMDLAFGWRMMRKTPATTAAAVLSLALGIGATTAILTLADAVLWRTIGVPAPEQMTEVFWASKASTEGLYGGASGSMFADNGMDVADFFSKPSFEQMRASVAGKAELAAYMGSNVVSVNYSGAVVVARLRGVSGNFFTMLQLKPAQGRLFVDADNRREATPVIVVTDRFRRRHMSGAAAVDGQVLRVNNTAYVVAGVLPASFTGIVPGDNTDLYAPVLTSPALLDTASFYHNEAENPKTWWMQLLARRSAQTTLQELHTILDTSFAASWTAVPNSPEKTPHVRLADASSGLGSMRRHFGNPVWILLGLVGMVLLVACANIANLLLARAVEREKEVALRISLGCSERRLVRQFFTESLMLAAIGGLLSVGIAVLLGRLMLTLLPEGNEGLTLSLDPDLRSLAATASVALLTALVFGLYPAFRTARVDVSPSLKEGSGTGGTSSRSRWAPAKALVILQVALGVLLVTAAIIFTGQLNSLASRDTGFERYRSVLFDVRPGELGYRGARLAQFYSKLQDRLAAVPGMESVALAQTRPMLGGGYWSGVRLPGQDKKVQVAVHHGTQSFHQAMNIPLLAGRAITQQEVERKAKVAVVSEDLAKELGTPAMIGLRLVMGKEQYEVVGIARNALYSDMGRQVAVLYLPFENSADSATVIAHTGSSPFAVLPAIRAAVKELDPNLPLVDVYTMEQQISRTLQRERMFAWLCGSFGVLALVLCVVGLYGLMSHTTARRTPEIGIRIALGASRSDVLTQVLREGFVLAAGGLAAGIPLAVWGVKLAEKQKVLTEGPLPYWTLGAALGVLAVAALAAVFGPAMRASGVDPMRALRKG
jgi:predicted permease